MSTGEKFLAVVSTFAGYCQICNEPRMVGRIAVSGWPYQGAVCSRCLSQLADEVERRAAVQAASEAGAGTGLATRDARNNTPLAATAGGNGHTR